MKSLCVLVKRTTNARKWDIRTRGVSFFKFILKVKFSLNWKDHICNLVFPSRKEKKNQRKQKWKTVFLFSERILKASDPNAKKKTFRFLFIFFRCLPSLIVDSTSTCRLTARLSWPFASVHFSSVIRRFRFM